MARLSNLICTTWVLNTHISVVSCDKIRLVWRQWTHMLASVKRSDFNIWHHELISSHFLETSRRFSFLLPVKWDYLKICQHLWPDWLSFMRVITKKNHLICSKNILYLQALTFDGCKVAAACCLHPQIFNQKAYKLYLCMCVCLTSRQG